MIKKSDLTFFSFTILVIVAAVFFSSYTIASNDTLNVTVSSNSKQIKVDKRNRFLSMNVSLSGDGFVGKEIYYQMDLLNSHNSFSVLPGYSIRVEFTSDGFYMVTDFLAGDTWVIPPKENVTYSGSFSPPTSGIWEMRISVYNIEWAQLKK